MQHIIAGESDIFVGRRARLTRYLVCALQGYFPVVVKTGPNALAAIFRTGATHLGVMGTLAVATSTDGGCSWSDPAEVCPRGMDARNPAFGVNDEGEWLLAYWKARLQSYDDSVADGGPHYLPQSLPGADQTQALFLATSADAGRTWRERPLDPLARIAIGSPYGRIVTGPSGELIMSVYGSPRQPGAASATLSTLRFSHDDGLTWGGETLIAEGYNETALALLPNGDLLAAARSQRGGHVAILRSGDLGRTWSSPQQVTRDGEHPADLTVLRSGAVLLTFGRRIRPMGCGALLSHDGGRTWNADREVLLAGDGISNTDLGYPSTVQLDDGHIVTLLYFASGSQMSQQPTGWGDVSCQAIHYRDSELR
jgi:BNR repeat-like domain